VKNSKATVALLLILSFTFVSISEVSIVKANETIYIREDGNVEGTDKIQRDGNVYTFTDDIIGSIFVERDNIDIDGAGYTLQGNGEGKGIELWVYSPSSTRIFNVTIKNLRIINFGTGIRIVNVCNNTIVGNYIADCDFGIDMMYSANNTIRRNTLANNIQDIYITYNLGTHVITENNMINDRYPLNNFIVFLWSPKPIVYRNYWSDYKGTDSNGDGIGDTPYSISNGITDNYPLVEQVPVIPEFPSWTSFLILLIGVLIVAVIYKQKLHNQNRRRDNQ